MTIMNLTEVHICHKNRHSTCLTACQVKPFHFKVSNELHHRLSGIVITCRVQYVSFCHCSVTGHGTLIVLMCGAADDANMWYAGLYSLWAFLINSLVGSVASVWWRKNSWYSCSIYWLCRWPTDVLHLFFSSCTCESHAQLDRLSRFLINHKIETDLRHRSNIGAPRIVVQLLLRLGPQSMECSFLSGWYQRFQFLELQSQKSLFLGVTDFHGQYRSAKEMIEMFGAS